MRSKVLLAATFLIYILITFNRHSWSGESDQTFDKAGYYLYLPAIFLYNDLGQLSFYSEVNKKYKLTDPYVPYYGCYKQPVTGKYLNKYPIGTAIVELPFFAIGHAITLLTHEYPTDGFSPYYALLICIGSIAWCIVGLIAIRDLLSRYFKEQVVFVVLLILGLGTNLYCYTAFEAGMSHPFSFAFFALALNSIDLYYRHQKLGHLLFTAVLLGLIIITRPSNIVLGIVILLWGVSDRKTFSDRARFYGRNWVHIISASVLFFAVLLIQMSYWKYATGTWLVYSYQEEGFNFLHPQIWKGLFSYRKGWFVYTPLALVGVLGLVPLKQKLPQFFWGIAIYLFLNIYIVFSWYQWYYGGGFGSRPLIESLAVLAIPMAAAINYVLSIKGSVKPVFMGLIIFLVALNVFQTYQYSRGIIPWDHNNRTYYWRTFFNIEHTPGDWDLLDFDEPD